MYRRKAESFPAKIFTVMRQPRDFEVALSPHEEAQFQCLARDIVAVLTATRYEELDQAMRVWGQKELLPEVPKVTAMSRPPPGRGCAVTLAWWALATAPTMARPNPCPLVWPTRSLPAFWNGWKSRSILLAGTVWPVLVTVMIARPGVEMVATLMLPRHARLPAARDDQPGAGRRRHRRHDRSRDDRGSADL